MLEHQLIYNNIKSLIDIRNYIYKYNFNENLNVDYLIIKTNQVNILYIINTESNILKKSDVFIKKINELISLNLQIIIITKYKISSNLQKKLALIKKNYIIEIILYNALLFNFTTNNVNKYTEIVKLSNIEQKKILDFLDINKSSLLYLCYDDMISIWYDLYPNDIIKIKTTSPLSNILTSYYKLVSKESLSGFRFLFINKDNIIILNDKSSDSSFESELDDKSDDLNNDDDSDVYSNKNNIDSDNEIGTDKGELCPHSDFVES